MCELSKRSARESSLAVGTSFKRRITGQRGVSVVPELLANQPRYIQRSDRQVLNKKPTSHIRWTVSFNSYGSVPYLLPSS